MPDDYFDDFGTKAVYSSTVNAEKVKDGAIFTADVMEIPANMLSTTFYAKSFVLSGGQQIFSEAFEATVNGFKNYTSR